MTANPVMAMRINSKKDINVRGRGRAQCLSGYSGFLSRRRPTVEAASVTTGVFAHPLRLRGRGSRLLSVIDRPTAIASPPAKMTSAAMRIDSSIAAQLSRRWRMRNPMMIQRASGASTTIRSKDTAAMATPPVLPPYGHCPPGVGG